MQESRNQVSTQRQMLRRADNIKDKANNFYLRDCHIYFYQNTEKSNQQSFVHKNRARKFENMTIKLTSNPFV